MTGSDEGSPSELGSPLHCLARPAEGPIERMYDYSAGVTSDLEAAASAPETATRWPDARTVTDYVKDRASRHQLPPARPHRRPVPASRRRRARTVRRRDHQRPPRRRHPRPNQSQETSRPGVSPRERRQRRLTGATAGHGRARPVVAHGPTVRRWEATRARGRGATPTNRPRGATRICAVRPRQQRRHPGRGVRTDP